MEYLVFFLSACAPDATYNRRVDHCCWGAYAARPSLTAQQPLGRSDDKAVCDWIRGFSRAARQGPIGQAHVVENYAPPVADGARKSPFEPPPMNDWANRAAAHQVDLVLRGLFGLHPKLDACPETGLQHIAHFDPGARLIGLRLHGCCYRLDRAGLHAMDDPQSNDGLR
ncbi:MAG: hypothetical protein GF344_08635 [Chitinivibrionales bacterium]|nr:hypothetical protein [Chitinivibrionales bacterium]MBD3356940.1 hypothetical protein [Chitinivibrionales bacterium]